jgi:hypothetical protein
MRFLRFWLREIAGWIMVCLGIFGFYVCFVSILYRQILEAGAFTFVSVVLFRGGIHLLKVAVAARICMQAAEAAAKETGASRVPGASRNRPENATRTKVATYTVPQAPGSPTLTSPRTAS